MKRLLSVATIAALGLGAIAVDANEADRRAAMKDIAGNAKGLREGSIPPAVAGQAIADLAATIPTLFMENEISGDSKAKPEIWANYDDFTAKATALEEAALALVTAANDGGDVAAAGKALGGACGSCHKSYKVPDQ